MGLPRRKGLHFNHQFWGANSWFQGGYHFFSYLSLYFQFVNKIWIRSHLWCPSISEISWNHISDRLPWTNIEDVYFLWKTRDIPAPACPSYVSLRVSSKSPQMHHPGFGASSLVCLLLDLILHLMPGCRDSTPTFQEPEPLAKLVKKGVVQG